MLDRAKLAHQMQQVVDSLFIDHSAEYEVARRAWDRIAHDVTIIHRLKQVQAPWPVPTWQGTIGQAIAVGKPIKKYQVLAVDGSQIYPDRHQGPSCFLINTGSVFFRYGYDEGRRVVLSTTPSIFSASQTEFAMSADLVNCQRQQLELQAGYEQAKVIKQGLTAADPFVLLFDGSLIFWLLEGKEPDIKQQFLLQYFAQLHQLYQEKILMASYVSLPKSKELVNVIRLALADFNPDEAATSHAVDHILDSTIASFYLEPYERSAIFRNNAAISEQYPDHIRPYFFYIHVGTEIGRVEIPAWTAREDDLVDCISRIIIDQCSKGDGYPIAIAEAHEQAVVKGPDRDFFYHLLTKVSIERKKHIMVSRKSMRKRRMGV